eukprot:CAMPEP_0178995730 /NCGR_PEP_ID=MMETSP0795-20121207/7974_1 /TAXON_ID=88552 /ORGANISM="Amoebophrya sp., Strain Ameob2" /LENGTH=252 /DNA_ID=CAMNT_0020688039 /DNA_START=53 /DNA_END=807 /DNA_ORIENTATION=-
MPGPKLVDCGVPEGSDLRSHFVHALEHMKHAESHAKAQLDNDVADLVNRAICNIEGETKSLLAYAVTSFLDPLMSVLGNPTQQTKVHDTRILLEQASQISRVASGGSAASEHLGCAALDLAAHDKTPNIHPVAMSSAGGAVSAVVAGWTMLTKAVHPDPGEDENEAGDDNEPEEDYLILKQVRNTTHLKEDKEQQQPGLRTLVAADDGKKCEAAAGEFLNDDTLRESRACLERDDGKTTSEFCEAPLGERPT